MGKAPAFQLYASDFYVDTNTWTIEEIGIYTRLLLSEWVNGGLPNDSIRLARACGCGVRTFEKYWRSISFKFHPNGNGYLVNDRLEEEREKQRKYKELQSNKGKLSAMKRSTTVETTVEPVFQPKVNSSSSSSSSSSNINSKEGEDTPFEIPEKEKMQEASEPMILNQIEEVCDQLYKEKIFPDVFAFKNKMLKKKQNPRAILHCLCRAFIKREFEEGPWAYCQKILSVEGGNYNERDFGKTSGRSQK